MSERVIDLGNLGLDQGGHLLVKRALRNARSGAVRVQGDHPDHAIHLRAWCREQGYEFKNPASGGGGVIHLDSWLGDRSEGAARAGDVAGVVANAPAAWGLAARGALVEAGSPSFAFALNHRDEIWSADAGRLYQQAVAAQWDPATAVAWDEPFDLPPEVEDAVVQVMTYLIENETAALIIPATFLVEVHPHFREVLQLLAIQAADEARHIEVFTRRATLRRSELGLSTAGGQASLKTLLDEPDFALSSFLLSVLGEGSFLTLLSFLQEHGPDPVTRRICKLAAQDEARHVAFGISHLAAHAKADPLLLERLAMAVHRRHDALSHTAGLNAEVFDALILLAAGSFAPDAIRRGWDAVQRLQRDMDEGRQKRLLRLGFAADQARSLSALHTRNFM